MDLQNKSSGMELLSELFGWEKQTKAEKNKKLIRNRPEIVRRPERATKDGFTGRTKGLTGTGKDQSGERKPQEVGQKKQRVNEFDDKSDWILTMIMVALMHANPELSPEEVIKESKVWARKISMPEKDHLWRKQGIRIKKHGIRAEASKIRRELFKLI